MRKVSDYILLYLKGVGMGAADLIPGVSGGTIAFISGIYDELLNSIKAVDASAFKLLFDLRFAEFWKKINGNFLAVLLAGIITSLLTLASLIFYLFAKYPILIWSFFFGLILISAPLILRKVGKWHTGSVLGFVLGMMVAYSLTRVVPIESPDQLFFIFLSGALAICAMILPGISGTFLLLLIGKYQYLTTALAEINIPVLLTFILGCTIGILYFARLLSWLLLQYRNLTIALLAGCMLGSLNKLWPWREVLEYATNSKGEQVAVFDRSVLPNNYFLITGNDPLILQSILMITLGVFFVILIERISTRLKLKQ